MLARYSFGKLVFTIEAEDGRISYSSSWNGDPVVGKMWTTNAWNVYKFIIDSALEDAWSMVYDCDDANEERCEAILPAWHRDRVESWGRNSIAAWDTLQESLNSLYRKI